MREAIEVVGEGFAALADGRATVPARTHLPLAEGGVALTMPASLQGGPHFAVKVVSVVPGNPGRGLPLVPATVLLGDARTGEAIALIEGASLTALRTGAAGGVAAAALARPDSTLATVFGAGAQARAQILALAVALPSLRAVRVVGRDPERVRDLIRWAREQPELRAVELAVSSSQSARDSADADVVVTATNSEKPVFPGSALREGAHVTAVGSFRPTMRELDEDAMRGARVVVDQRAAALAEAGELAGLGDADVVEIGEVVAGRAAGRTSAAERTVFKSVGNAVQDLVVASRAYARARELGIGEEIGWP